MSPRPCSGFPRHPDPRARRLHGALRSSLLALLLAGAAGAQSLTVACEDKMDFPQVLGEGQAIPSKDPGVSVEFIRRLGKELGLAITIKRLPWKRALELELRNGTIDGLFPVSHKKGREAFGVLPWKDGKVDESRSMFASTYFFYKLKSSPLAWDGKVLKGLQGPIGAPRGYSIVGDLRDMGYEVQESDDVRKDMKRLGQGWLGAMAGLESAQDHLLDSSPGLGRNIVKVQPPISTKPYYLMLSHAFVERNPELAQRIWDACRELREKELPRLMRKYVGK